MFGISLIKTSKLKHLYSETSKLAIENVKLNKEIAKRDATISDIKSQLDTEQQLAGYLANEYNHIDYQNQYLKRVIAGFQNMRISGKRKKKR